MKLVYPPFPVKSHVGTAGTDPAITVGVSGTQSDCAPDVSKEVADTVAANFTMAPPQDTAISDAESEIDAGAR
jgi:hypothetical protein